MSSKNSSSPPPSNTVPMTDLKPPSSNRPFYDIFTPSIALALPQDAGDALLNYITKARPRVDEERVFLRVHAPYRPLSDSSRISAVVRHALDRAGVVTTGSRGAHLIRHSVATGLLRSGATLETVGSLLRHRSSVSTAIYAKVDANMLREVAQPWIGGGATCH